MHQMCQKCLGHKMIPCVANGYCCISKRRIAHTVVARNQSHNLGRVAAHVLHQLHCNLHDFICSGLGQDEVLPMGIIPSLRISGMKLVGLQQMQPVSQRKRLRCIHMVASGVCTRLRRSKSAWRKATAGTWELDGTPWYTFNVDRDSPNIPQPLLVPMSKTQA